MIVYLRHPIRPGRMTRRDRWAIGVVAATALWWVTNRLCGDLRYIGYLNAFGIWWSLIAAIAGGSLAFRRRYVDALVAIVLAGIIASEGMAFNFGPPSSAHDGRHFRLVTVSLRTYNRDMASAAANLASFRADVLVVQEASDVVGLMAQVDSASHAHWNYVSRGNEIIACRCAIGARSERDYLLSADVTWPGGGAVRVWNVRAPKDYADPAVNAAYFIALSDQLREVGSGIAAGDFNATPWNDSYRTVAALARDAWREGGWGAGLTFSAPARRLGAIMPLVSIDHVFIRGPMHAERARIGTASLGADHYPVIVDLVAD